MKKEISLKESKNPFTSIKDKYSKSFIFLWEYIKTYKNAFIFVITCSFMISLFNSSVTIIQYYFMEYITKAFEDGKTDAENIKSILFLVFLLIAIFTSSILYIFQSVMMTKIAQHTGKIIRKDLYFKILELKLQYFDSTPSGDIMSRLTNDINNITIALNQNVTQFLISSSQITFFLITLVLFSPIMGLIALVFVPIQLSVVYLLFKKAQPNFALKQTSLGDLNGFVEETISGQKVINNFNKQDLVIEEFRKRNEEIRSIGYKSDLLASVSNPWNTLMGNSLLAIMFIVAMVMAINNVEFGGIVKTTIDGKTNYALVLSLLTAIMTFSRNFSQPIYQIFQLLNLLQAAIAGADRARVIKDQQIEVDKEKESVDVSDLKGDINFKNLTFSYDGKRNVLKNINLHVKPGQVVGIVGPTGSGKTTIINLLTKFYDVEDSTGDILIDGTSIKSITKESLRKEVSIVLQDTFIFGDTIYENIRYAKPDATNEEIEEAAKRANIHSFIMSLDKGYETILENNADDISQGQKQLLAVARAFLKKSSILILDEATSSVDTKTEKDIQSAMIELSKGKTTFMIAHRLSTIKHADIIVVLKDGEILEQGNHAQLLSQQGFYANMYNSKLNTPEDV